MEERELGQMRAAGYTSHLRARPARPNLEDTVRKNTVKRGIFNSPEHLRSQEIEKSETSPVVSVPVLRADDGDQRSIGIGSAGTDIDTLKAIMLELSMLHCWRARWVELTMTIRACSLMENCPGLTSKVKGPKGTLHRGSFSQARPMGKTRSWATT